MRPAAAASVLVFRFRGIARQIVRNMRSIGIDLQPWVRKGLLLFKRGSTYGGIEEHLLVTHKRITSFHPASSW